MVPSLLVMSYDGPFHSLSHMTYKNTLHPQNILFSKIARGIFYFLKTFKKFL
jgi:hypothetical protein